MTKRWIAVFFAALTLAGSPAFSAPGKGKSSSQDSVGEAQGAGGLGGSDNVDRKRFELSLRQRLKKIDAEHQARLEFFSREQAAWITFWNKVRDERRLFEIRITRETLDLFESLASLDQKDYPTTIANFEKLQADVIRSFESDQKEKIAEFFAAREARWKQFEADQEKERADFVSDAQQGWQDAKASLKNPEAAGADAPPPSPAVTGADDQH